MTPRPYPLSFDPRLRTLEGKLELVAQLRADRPEKSVPLLLELLCDQSWHVRERATEALVERGDDVVGPLIALLDEGLWYTRACAAQALGQIGAVTGLKALAQHLADDNATVRRAVAGALAAMGRRHGGGPVLTALAEAGIDLGRTRGPEEWAGLAEALGDAKPARAARGGQTPEPDPGTQAGGL